MLYLWLTCEGWERFGPFKWLRFNDANRLITDQDGNVVASFDGNCWRTPGKKYKEFGWSDPMITSSAKHPHPMQQYP